MKLFLAVNKYMLSWKTIREINFIHIT